METDTRTANDPVYVADCIMACLFTMGQKRLNLTIDYEGDEFPFFLTWDEPSGTNTNRIGVQFNGAPVLLVDLFMRDSAELVGAAPLKKQVLHKVKVFEDGPWARILLGALYVDRGRQ